MCSILKLLIVFFVQEFFSIKEGSRHVLCVLTVAFVLLSWRILGVFFVLASTVVLGNSTDLDAFVSHISHRHDCVFSGVTFFFRENTVAFVDTKFMKFINILIVHLRTSFDGIVKVLGDMCGSSLDHYHSRMLRAVAETR